MQEKSNVTQKKKSPEVIPHAFTITMSGFYSLFAAQQKSKNKKQKLKQTKKQKQNKKCHIKRLSDDSWNYIFQFINFKDNVDVERSCKLLNKIINQYGITTYESFEMNGFQPKNRNSQFIHNYIIHYMSRVTNNNSQQKFKCKYIKNISIKYPRQNENCSNNNIPSNYYSFLSHISKIGTLQIEFKKLNLDSQ